MNSATNGTTNFVRPNSLDQVVGLEHVKNILHYDINGCLQLKEPLPHYVISGPPGTGKTLIANIIAGMTKGDVHKYIGTELKKANDIYDIAQTSKDKDVIFIEEAHGLGKEAQIILLEWCENYQLLGGGAVGGNAPKVSFVLPTTNPGKICKPLRDRCRTLSTSYYTIDELKVIIRQAANKFGFEVNKDDNALTLLAQSSRGTPRIAVMHRLDMLRKVMTVDKLEYNTDTVNKMLDLNSINEWGLEPNDIKYCQALYDKMSDNNNRPVSKKIMSQCTGFDEDLIDIIEGYLQQISAIRVGTQGRVLNSLGCTLIDKPVLVQTVNEHNKASLIDMDKLAILIQDPEIRKQGMRRIATEFNLKYGPDNATIKAALERIGATAKRRAGIVMH